MVESSPIHGQLSLLIVDDNFNFSPALKRIGIFNNVRNLFENNNGLIKNTTLNISQKIKEIISNNNTIPIVINIEGTYENAKRQEQKGVEILLWLRCKFRISNPIIVYSFQNIHQLLNKKPENYIICSEGCYYFHLPFDFSRLNFSLLEPVKSWGGLKKYLKPAFSIEEFRHREANWWGLVQLIDVHRFIFPNELVFDGGKEYPSKVIRILENLNNIIALGLYGHNILTISIEKILFDNFCKELISIKKQIELYEKKLTHHPARKNPRPDELVDFLNDRQILIREKERDRKWNSDTRPIIEKQIQETQQKINEANEELKNLTDRKAKIESELDPLKPRTISVKQELSNAINKLRFIDKKNKPKILYIDDQAYDGWSEIFQFMIYGKICSDHFTVANVNFHCQTSEEFIDKIFDDLKSYLANIDLILLDLRLLPSGDEKQKYNIEWMSGSMLLIKIRSEYPGIPIIITTASNKVWTYEKLIELGADAYWIKEGIDEQRQDDQAVKNYFIFLELINKILCNEYSLLKYFSDEIIKLRRCSRYWWQECDWTKVGNAANMKNVNIPLLSISIKENIFEILENSFLILREYLQLKIFQHGFNPYIKEKEWFFPSQIIQNLGKIIEEVHNFDIVKNTGCNIQTRGLICGYPKDGSFVVTRKDLEGNNLYEIRNRASHIEHSKTLKWSNVEDYVRRIMLYLEMSPREIQLDKIKKQLEYEKKNLSR